MAIITIPVNFATGSTPVAPIPWEYNKITDNTSAGTLKLDLLDDANNSTGVELWRDIGNISAGDDSANPSVGVDVFPIEVIDSRWFWSTSQNPITIEFRNLPSNASYNLKMILYVGNGRDVNATIDGVTQTYVNGNTLVPPPPISFTGTADASGVISVDLNGITFFGYLQAMELVYDDGGGGTGVTVDGLFNIPALTVSSSASATLPQPSASGAFDLSALTIASNASATLPQPDTTGLFNLSALTVSGASSATLPQPSANGAFNLSAITVDGSVTASLPNPTLTVAFNLNTLTVSGNATATSPNFTASGAFDLPTLTVTGGASSTQPNPTVSGTFDIGSLLFSGASGATLPQPSASAAFNLNTFNFTGNASVTEPTFTASGGFNIPAIIASGSGSATFPQPSAEGSFALPQLQINGNITVSGLIITPSQDAVLYASVGDSISYTDNTSNILYLH